MTLTEWLYDWSINRVIGWTPQGWRRRYGALPQCVGWPPLPALEECPPPQFLMSHIVPPTSQDGCPALQVSQMHSSLESKKVLLVCLVPRMASGVIFVTGDGKWTLSPSTPSGSSSLPSLSEEIGQPAQNTSSTQAKVHGRIKHLLYYLLNTFWEIFCERVFIKMLFCLKLFRLFRRAKSLGKSHLGVLITKVRISAEIYRVSFHLVNMLYFCYF